MDERRRIEGLLQGFGARIAMLVRQHCRPQQGLDPDDVAQEVRIRLWRLLERDRNAPLAASYLSKVVASVVVDALRRAKVRAADPLPEDDDGFDPSLIESATPLQRAEEGARMAQLKAALAGLPERRRQGVALHLQGFTAAEIGELCACSAEAARKLVDRGLDELRAVLRPAGMEHGDDERD